MAAQVMYDYLHQRIRGMEALVVGPWLIILIGHFRARRLGWAEALTCALKTEGWRGAVLFVRLR